MEEKKNMLKNWKLWGIIVVIILIIAGITIFALRNNLTPEETVSKFMYLIENKEYEKAKKLCSGKLEYLDLLSNTKPSNLRFEYSEDKKNATSVLLEDKETAEITKMYVELSNSLLGWKIKSYTVNTGLIPQAELQTRLENGEDISESEFLLWASHEETKVEDISKYATDDLMILIIFADFMKDKSIEKAMKLYEPLNIQTSPYFTELKEEEIKEFNWSDYSIINSSGNGTYIISDGKKEITIMITNDNIIRSICQYNKIY